MDTEKLKDICRGMITASHYDNLDDAEFDNYIESIISEVRKPSPELRQITQDIIKSYLRRNLGANGLIAHTQAGEMTDLILAIRVPKDERD